MEYDFLDFITLKESTYNETSGEVEVVLIEAGTNKQKKRHYPEKTIQEAAPLFSGLKMYLNHPTKKEEAELPERDVTKWVSTITESRYENGKAIAKVAVHDNWLRERLKDPVARKHIGLSINTGGRVSKGKVDGEEMEIVEKIVLQRSNGPASVDWVTEAGARGRVSKLLKENNIKENEMEFKDLTLEQLKKERPDLIESVAKDIKESSNQIQENQKKDKELKEAQAKIAELEKKDKINAQKAKVETLLKEAKTLPEVAKTRIANSINANLIEDEVKLKEAVEAQVKSELEYVNSISGKGKIKTGSAGSDKSLKESIQEELEGRMGIKKEDNEE